MEVRSSDAAVGAVVVVVDLGKHVAVVVVVVIVDVFLCVWLLLLLMLALLLGLWVLLVVLWEMLVVLSLCVVVVVQCVCVAHVAGGANTVASGALSMESCCKLCANSCSAQAGIDVRGHVGTECCVCSCVFGIANMVGQSMCFMVDKLLLCSLCNAMLLWGKRSSKVLG